MPIRQSPSPHHYRDRRRSYSWVAVSPGLMVLAITLVGAGLRLWHLGDKSLWLDEVIAALFSLGRRLEDVPLDQAFSLETIETLFTYRPGLSCGQIAQTVATQSVHPPLFFCLLYSWMGWLLPHSQNWVWALRALPALLGILMVPLGYWLGRLALSPQAGPKTGLTAAALVAVSPFAVYLSQEARHYTLPMALIAVALALLLHLQRAMGGGAKPWVVRGLLLAWVLVNSIGLYVHYFFLLTVIAQVAAIGLWLGRSLVTPRRIPDSRRAPEQAVAMRTYIRDTGIAILVIALSYLPWLPTMLGHLSRPETDWLKPYNPDWRDRLAPLYQIPSGWILSVVALPIEAQPAAIATPAAIVMLIVSAIIGWHTLRGLWRLRRSPTVGLLATFVAAVLLQFLAIVYILDKDITAIPRYNFVYYPGLVVLVAAGLTAAPEPSDAPKVILPSRPPNWGPAPLTVALIAGMLSSLLVVHGLVFQKGYYPARVAQDIAFEADTPVFVAVSYQSLQEVALGLSFARALRQQRSDDETDRPVAIAFIDRKGGYGPVWRQFPELQPDLPLPLNLWVIASPGMKTKDYPKRLRLHTPSGRARCVIVPERFSRIGFPYQLFRCQRPGQALEE
ncbi:MAG: hypothetical protein ACFB5Z_14615 [Elainellaceae cyanobacterium]